MSIILYHESQFIRNIDGLSATADLPKPGDLVVHTYELDAARYNCVDNRNIFIGLLIAQGGKYQDCTVLWPDLKN